MSKVNENTKVRGGLIDNGSVVHTPVDAVRELPFVLLILLICRNYEFMQPQSSSQSTCIVEEYTIEDELPIDRRLKAKAKAAREVLVKARFPDHLRRAFAEIRSENNEIHSIN